MLKILVTGCAGFIGSHLSEKLLKIGYQVEGIDNFSDYYSKDLKELNAKSLLQHGIKLIKADLTEPLNNVLAGNYDYVFHLAAQPSISASVSLNTYIDNNIQATNNLIEFLIANNPTLKGFINISTSSVYGKEATLNEDQRVQPISYYGITKFAAEQLVMAAQQKNKIKACSVRLYSVYGPRERPEKLYTKLIDAIFNNKDFPLFEGSLQHSRSFTYVGDIVEGLVACIPNFDKINGELINLGSDSEYTTAQGIHLIETIIGKKANFINLPAREGDQLRTSAIIDKARKLLNYNPKTSFEEGLKHQIDWYKTNFM